MATKPDFAQKLLHDLRLRKQRMATAQNSDMYGNSRQNLKGSRGTKTLETVGPKIGSRYRSSTNSQKSHGTIQNANQMVPYTGGQQAQHSGQVADLSMALSYAFDNRGKLKRLDIASTGAMMDLLQQIGRRSMQQSLDIQWQSANQFPTLKNLHIDEIAKGARKLNQILRACSSGINIDEGSIDIGKDLWKGAMELEQSLRMLVSLQEASENTMSQKRKSRLKLLDEDGDSEDDSTVSSEKQKQVERPVFSFDKPTKNSKASVKTDLQKNLLALPYREDPNSNPERNTSMTPKGTHRRSASCSPEIQTSQLANSSKPKHNAARLPNVVAKLMGLEDLPQNKVATDSPISHQGSRELVPVHTAERSSKSAGLNTEYTKNAKILVNQNKVHSNKITILTTHKIELQEETYRSTNSHRMTTAPVKPRWNEEEGEGIKDYIKESKAAIFKINELQSKTIHLNQDGESQKDVRKEVKVRSIKQRRQEVAYAMETLQRMVAPENRSLIVAETMKSYTPDNSNARETPKTAASKPLIPQQKQNRDILNMSYEPQGKNLKADSRSQQRERKKEGNVENLQNSRTIGRESKHMQKQLHIKQPNAGKKNAEDIGLADSKTALLSSRQKENPVRDGNFMSSEDKRKGSASLRSDDNGSSTDGLSESHMTEVCARPNIDAKCAHDSPKKVVGDIRPPKIRPRPVVKTKEDITKTVTTPRTAARALRSQRPTPPYRLKQNKVDKINVSRTAAEANESISKSAESIPGNHVTSKPPVYEESQQNVDVEQTITKNHTIRDKASHRLKRVTTPADKDENIVSTVIEDQREKLVPYEAEIMHQITEKDGQEDCNNNSCNQQQKQQKPVKMVKQEPLTEDELFLKQNLIKSHLILNTAEALFKLNIPISILNYASDQICEEKDSKIILDCGYELLKRKGRQENFFYASTKIFRTGANFRSLDDLVKQLHKDFEALRYYGRNGRDEYDDYANCILKLLETDIYNRHPDLNCMWDIGWNESKFQCAKMDEAIGIIEQLMLDELVDELANDCL
ncbi:uncharacterized protein LOC110692791 [Chenopodium quinoa]|uniref:DUF3741 domain-containing protein n=1 Tax=Chenopodium quinoa TaxID=63459 RepID=A0A803MCW3_CHEQI|nr:uncharacterized protein LOC110692791 [Chenopodium quinoa]